MKLLERGPRGGGENTPRPAAYSERRGIVASAHRVNLKDRREVEDLSITATQARAWQDDAWRHHDRIGEVWFAHNLIANVMSRIRLYPGFVADSDSPPIPLSDAATIERPEGESQQRHQTDTGLRPQQAVAIRDVYRKAMGRSKVPNIMRSFTLNISVPGDCHLAYLDGEWQIKSTSELIVDTSQRPKLYRVRGGQPKDLPEDTKMGRIWREHARYSNEPDSAMRPLSEDCEELLLLNRVIRSNSRVRLHAGLLYVPDEIVVVNQTLTDDEEVEEDEEANFEKELIASITAAINDENNLASILPTLLRGPGELADKIKHIKFERIIDEFLVARADRTLERVMQGLDVPKDVVTGLANVKYSNAIQIDESLYKAHVEPLCLVICDAITEIVFRPALQDAAEELGIDPDRFVVWYDPSEVTTRPDRAGDAKTLYDANELSGKALRAAHGFSESDRPSEEEVARKLAFSNAPPPEVMMVLLQRVLPNVLKQLAQSGAAAGELPAELQSTLAGTEVPGEPEPLEPTTDPAAIEEPLPEAPPEEL